MWKGVPVKTYTFKLVTAWPLATHVDKALRDAVYNSTLANVTYSLNILDESDVVWEEAGYNFSKVSTSFGKARSFTLEVKLTVSLPNFESYMWERIRELNSKGLFVEDYDTWKATLPKEVQEKTLEGWVWVS